MMILPVASVGKKFKNPTMATMQTQNTRKTVVPQRTRHVQGLIVGWMYREGPSHTAYSFFFFITINKVFCHLYMSGTLKLHLYQIIKG